MSHWKKLLGHPPWCRRLPWRALRLCQEPLDPLGKTNLPGLAVNAFSVECVFHKLTPGWRVSHQPLTPERSEAIAVLARRRRQCLLRVLELVNQGPVGAGMGDWGGIVNSSKSLQLIYYFL